MNYFCCLIFKPVHQKTFGIFFFFIFVLNATTTRAEQLPSSVLYNNLLSIKQETEQLYYEFGKTPVKHFHYKISGVNEIDLYYQTLNIFKKIDRLVFDHIGSLGLQVFPIAFSKIRLEHSIKNATDSLERIKAIRKKNHFEIISLKLEQHENIDFDSIYQLALQINRMLNSLVDTPYQPSTVYKKLTEAIYIAQNIFKGESQLPILPPYINGKTPTDTYKLLLSVLKKINKQVKTLSYSCINLEVKKFPSLISSADVYDIAFLVVTNLFYISEELKLNLKIPPIPYPGRKFPSHIFQISQQIDEMVQLLPEKLNTLRGAK